MAEELYMTDFQFKNVKLDTYYKSAIEAAKAVDEAEKNGTDIKQAIYDKMEKFAKKATGMSFGTDE